MGDTLRFVLLDLQRLFSDMYFNQTSAQKSSQNPRRGFSYRVYNTPLLHTEIVLEWMLLHDWLLSTPGVNKLYKLSDWLAMIVRNSNKSSLV